ncbi:MAG: hypothetical protein HY698_06235 [Deltaproteobacteria bacterium]|nr:hypothetical protein [Deltaproteobacteria bacterium]
MKAWLQRNRLPAFAFALALLIFGATTGTRLRRQSSDPHFVLQAHAWLSGRLHVESWPSAADDPAKVEEVELDDGSLVRGRRIEVRRSFRLFGGQEVPVSRIKRTVRTIHHVSFPSFPAVLMLPQAAIHGPIANDVATTVILAALVPAFFLVLLGRLRQAGLSTRTPREDAWLTALLTIGSVFFFSAVQGRVWFTAHVVGVLLATLYAWASVGATRPFLAGLFLGLAFVTRSPMLFMFPLFLFEAARVSRRDRPALLRRMAWFAAPIMVIGLVAAWHNHARFGELAEFGHSYLAVRQRAQIERFGLFDLSYLSRNLSVALTLLPDFSRTPPFLSVSGHGMAIWITTPALLLLLWPRHRGPLHHALWTTVAMVAGWSLLYQNSGWVQFGYRFSLDYMVFLVMLLAVGARPLTRTVKGLILVGVLVNLFGAVTFHRYGKFYRSDTATYDCVVRD